jgi:hypothetical protein
VIAVEMLEIETSISFSLNELFCVGEERERRELVKVEANEKKKRGEK